jgi:hypothetical protein
MLVFSCCFGNLTKKEVRPCIINSTMKQTIFLFTLLLVFFSCSQTEKHSSFNPVNWEKRSISLDHADSLQRGSSYLSVYSEIYSSTQDRTYDLTATISIRNISMKDTIYILDAEYFNTQGDLIRAYFSKPVFVKPLETIEIVVDQNDRTGGTGANFIFHWAVPSGAPDPLFEAVMISTSGQQGLSFTTTGVKVD